MAGTDAGIEFVRMDSDYYVDDTYYPRRTYDLHCPGCGRYCKHVRSHYVYNGNWDVLWVKTSCVKCGVIDTPWG